MRRNGTQATERLSEAASVFVLLPGFLYFFMPVFITIIQVHLNAKKLHQNVILYSMHIQKLLKLANMV